jgi:ABC-type uncharacterized transport system involved in gliding motility auxiliary subunit
MEGLRNLSRNFGWLALLCVVAAAFCYRLLLESHPWSVTAALSAALVLFVLYAVFQRERIVKTLTRGRTQSAVNTLVVVAVSLAILGVLNYLAAQHNKRFDLTSSGLFTLAEQSRNVARSLDAPVDVYAFFRTADAGERQEFDDLMDAYRLETPQLHPHVVDPIERRDLAELHNITEFGTVVFDRAGGTKRTTEISEESFTRTLIELTTGEARAVYFLAGHKELSFESSDEMTGFSLAAERLGNMNYEVKEFSLIPDLAVPGDAAAVVIAAPKKPLLDKERDILTEYAERRGGRLLVLLERESAKEWREWLLGWGLRVLDATVVDPVGASLFGNYFLAAASGYSTTHPATETFPAATFLPLAVPVEADPEVMKDEVSGHAEALAWTSEAAWGDIDEAVFQFDEGVDLEGPLPIAAYARIDPPASEAEKTEQTEETEERPEGRVIVVGDADFASNGYQHLSGNADLFANFVNWLAEQESLLGIAPNKAKASSPAPPSSRAARSGGGEGIFKNKNG